MAKVVVSVKAGDDIVRLIEFLAEENPQWAAEAMAVIHDGIGILADHPLIGRPADLGLKELVISRGRSGYLAFYDFDEDVDLVMILALRHQREAGYA
jgi:plasmid stabilization system protein ParE